jgi:hypothetical protein
VELAQETLKIENLVEQVEGNRQVRGAFVRPAPAFRWARCISTSRTTDKAHVSMRNDRQASGEEIAYAGVVKGPQDQFNASRFHGRFRRS